MSHESSDGCTIPGSPAPDCGCQSCRQKTWPTRKVSICVVPVGKGPTIVDIPATLEAQQQIVDGLIQPLDIPNSGGLSVVVNEEGLIHDLPLNRSIKPWGDLYGPIYFARWDAEGEIQSLRLEDMITIVECLDPSHPQ